MTGIGNGIVWFTGGSTTQYVVVFAESGVVGLTSFCTLVAFALWGALSIDDEHLSVYLVSELTTVASELMFYISYRLAYIWFVFGLCIAAGVGFGTLEAQFRNARRESFVTEMIPTWSGSVFPVSSLRRTTINVLQHSTLYRWPVTEISPERSVIRFDRMQGWPMIERAIQTFIDTTSHSSCASTVHKLLRANQRRVPFTVRVGEAVTTA